MQAKINPHESFISGNFKALYYTFTNPHKSYVNPLESSCIVWYFILNNKTARKLQKLHVTPYYMFTKLYADNNWNL